MSLFLLMPFYGTTQNVSVTITEKNISIEDVFRQIEKQTSYTIAFNYSDLNIYNKVILPANFLSLGEIFSVILKNTGCEYRITEKHIIIIPKQSNVIKENNLTDIEKYQGLTFEKELKEILVTTGTVLHDIDRNVYIVTSKMKEGTTNSFELLDKIHGVRFDKISNSIKVGSNEAVLLLVDGLKQSQEFIKNLSPDRISRIEVLNELSGRYLSENYSSIINFILKKDYSGYDINVTNYSIINPVGTNGNDWLANEQPGVGITYTQNRFNLYGTYYYGRSRWNTPINRKILYKDLMEMQSENVSTTNPNDHYKKKENTVTTGLNYQIHPSHSLSLQGDYTYSYIHTNNNFSMNTTSLVHKDKFLLKNSTINQAKDNDYIISLFYKGIINEKFHLYSDLSYNYYSNNIVNKYLQKNMNGNSMYYTRENIYQENKKQITFNLETIFTFQKGLSLNAGYSNNWRKYTSDSFEYRNPLNYNDLRNRLYAYLFFNPTENLKMKLGATIEHIHIDNKYDFGNNYWSFQPYIQLNYSTNNNMDINVSYSTNNYYPSLYQLSPMQTAYDSVLFHIGNPQLKSATRHNISVRLTLWDRLSISPSFKYTPDWISEIYKAEGVQYRTFENVDFRQYLIQAIYDQPLGEYFNLKSMFAFYYNKVKEGEIKNSSNSWLINAEINYYNPTYNIGAEFGYYREMDKHVLLQGYQMINMDKWALSVNKLCWDNRLSIALSYIPPISWGVRYNQLKKIDTPNYVERTNLNLKTYNNMIFIRLGIRFNSGNTNRTRRETNLEREKREERTIEF